MESAASHRTESDSLGTVGVPVGVYWGAQTQRNIQNFPIGTEKYPNSFVRALGIQKWAAARANVSLGILDERLGHAIEQAADELIERELADHFVVGIWQSGSGTSANMNANEIIANRANEILGAPLGAKSPVHPNDHVNLSQSSNDTIPTAMHIAAVTEIEGRLAPALMALERSLRAKVRQFRGIIKVGRTHLQDAVPLAMGREFATYADQVKHGGARINGMVGELSYLVQGGTAVGTGLNAPAAFDTAFVDEVSARTGHSFKPARNKFEGIAAHDAVAAASGALSALAAALLKIANDIRLLGSGPRCGLGELALPANEPGSSIMPGKINPTQAEALSMVCLQVMGNHATIAFAAGHGQLELNAFRPVIIHNFLQSVALLADASSSFAERSIDGLIANRAAIKRDLEHSLMLVTALAPRVGYDRAAEIALKAHREGSTLREAALALDLVSAEEFDDWVRPEAMLAPDAPDR